MSRKGRENTALVLGALASVGEGYLKAKTKQLEQESDAEIIGQMDNPELTPVAKAQLTARLSKNGQAALTNMLVQQKRAEKILTEEGDLDLRAKREKRLEEQSSAKNLERVYRARLSDIKDQLKEARLSEKKALQDEQKALIKEFGQNLARVKRGEKPRFEVLEIEEEPIPAKQLPFEGMSQLGGGPSMAQQAPVPSQPQGQFQRQRWNPQDPAHQQRSLEILEASNGDRALANQQLSQEFER